MRLCDISYHLASRNYTALTQPVTTRQRRHFVQCSFSKIPAHTPFHTGVCRLESLANGGWLSYPGVVGILLPEQLRAVAEGLCWCHIIDPVSVLKVSMCVAGVCPGIHRRFSDSSTFQAKKKQGRFVGIFFLKEKHFFSEMSILAADKAKITRHYRLLLDRRVRTSVETTSNNKHFIYLYTNNDWASDFAKKHRILTVFLILTSSNSQ